jgi:hypothetical protein
MDDPVDLMPQVMGRTHVVEWEDIPAKKRLNIITNKNMNTGMISLFLIFLIQVDKEDNHMKP